MAIAAGISAAILILAPIGQRAIEVTGEPATTTTTAAAVSTTQQPTPVTTTAPPATVPPIEALIPLTADGVANRVSPSVAFVLTQQGTGSGVVISEDLLVTNAHVIWPDRTVSLVFLNGATAQARVLAMDPFVDLAVVDISRIARRPPPLPIGTTEDIAAGDSLWIVGYPLPTEFTPDPSIDAGEILGFTDWEFSEVRWLTVDAPAIGGQSGGAVVDTYGRLVGISTFGSVSSLTSIGIDDVVGRVDQLLANRNVRGLEPRMLPHGGARKTLDVSLSGRWDQQLFVGWLPARPEVTVAALGSGVDMAVRTIDGTEVALGVEQVQFRPGLVFPVILAVDAEQSTETAIEASLPFISMPDPDHGQSLPRRGATDGVYDVGRDRDFFYLELVEGERAEVRVESAARTHLWVYGPDGSLVAEDIDESGFIGGNATLVFTADQDGTHIVALENSLSTISGYTVVTR